MVKSQPWPHEDTEFFRSAVSSTAANEKFAPELIEKDYFCSVVLKVVYETLETSLVFKGGTLLNKAYTDFSRLSEDLDFSISVRDETKRAERKKLAGQPKAIFSDLPERIPGVKVREDLRGSNESQQYNGILEYRSILGPEPQTLLFQVGLREKVFEPRPQNLKTLLQDPFRQKPVIEPFTATALSRQEAYAEKLRAALTRETPAIRDLYDIHRALTSKLFDIEAESFRELVLKKLAIPGTPPIDVSEARHLEFERQTTTDLRPVLRSNDFEHFRFIQAWDELQTIGKTIQLLST
ncbi:MAG: nucleotidyl transferase AbiEii/AbiGii toxin family protein [Pseudomonadota bacterium]